MIRSTTRAIRRVIFIFRFAPTIVPVLVLLKDLDVVVGKSIKNEPSSLDPLPLNPGA